MLEQTVAELSGRGEVTGIRTDVVRLRVGRRARRGRVRPATAPATCCSTTPASRRAAAACRGSRSRTTGSGASASTCSASPTASLAFVPRMIASGEPGVIVNTSSGDGGIAPVPYASVYAASKAAISCFTESLAHQLLDNGTNLRAAVFYPSGGLLDTGLWTAERNRPPELAREREHTPGPVADLRRVPRAAAVAGHERRPRRPRRARPLRRRASCKPGSFVIGHDLDEAGDAPARPGRRDRSRCSSRRTTTSEQRFHLLTVLVRSLPARGCLYSARAAVRIAR